jgi:sugar lactone lactonase YvrE
MKTLMHSIYTFYLSLLLLISTGIPNAQAAALLVSSGETDSVIRYDGTTGAFIDIFASGGGLDYPNGMSIGPDGNLYVGSAINNRVLRYDGTTGAFIDTFIAAGSGGLKEPDGIVFGPDGNLYVSSRETVDRVLRYDGATGAFLGAFTKRPIGEPDGLTFGPDGNLYVSSDDTNEVLRFDGTTGAFIDTFVSAGAGGLNDPERHVFGPDGNFYVTSWKSNNVLRYNGTTGAFIDVFASGGGLGGPLGLAFGPDGNLYVANESAANVLRFNGTTGAFIDIFAKGRMVNPGDVVFTPISNSQANDEDILDFIPAIINAARKTPAQPPQIDFTGNWTVHEDATSLDPYCSGSVDHSVVITKLNDGTYTVVDSGSPVVAQGVLVNESLIITYKGTYPEDGGTTTSNFSGTATYSSTTGYSMTGHEDWSWTDGEYRCSGESTFRGVKNTP